MNNPLSMLKKFFSAPVFEGNEEKTRVARILNTVLYSLVVLVVGGTLAGILASLITRQPLTDISQSIVPLLLFISLIVLMRLGFVRQVSFALAFVLSATTTQSLLNTGMLTHTVTSGYLLAIIIAGLLSGGRSSLTIAVFNLLSLGAFNYLIAQGVVQAQPLATTDFVAPGAFFSISAFLLSLSHRSTREAITKARENEAQLKVSNRELQELSSSLERRVVERTRAITLSSEVSRQLSTITERSELVKQVVDQLQTAFNFYHVHIYLSDAQKEYLLMAGGTGEAGHRMLAQFHKIKMGRGLVGSAAETNKVVLVADTAQNPEWLPNSLLPDTKSEAAIPFSIGGQVLGVLDIQQNMTDGIHPEDVEALQVIANQVAVALQNIRLYEDTRKIAADMGVVANVGIATSTITETDRLLQEVVDVSKKSFGLYHAHIYMLNEATNHLELTAGAGEVGRQMVAEKRSIAIDTEQSLVARAARTGQGVVVNDVTTAPDFLPNPLLPDTRAEMAVPMVAGGKVIGVLDVQSEQAGRFTEVDVNIKTTLAAQVAIAVQNARSFVQSKQLAEREAAINVITQRIQSANDIETALQIAARELGHALGQKPTLVALNMESLTTATTKK